MNLRVGVSITIHLLMYVLSGYVFDAVVIFEQPEKQYSKCDGEKAQSRISLDNALYSSVVAETFVPKDFWLEAKTRPHQLANA